MKNLKIVLALAFVCLCPAVASAQSIGDILSGVAKAVIGDKATTESSIVGTWTYSGPACEFESSNFLSKAGGNAVSSKIEKKITPTLKKLGVTGISYTFDKDGNYTSKIKSRETKGTYKFDSSAKTITFTTSLGTSYTAYVTTTGSTMSLLFNADKLMTGLKAISSVTSGLSSTASILSSIAGTYDGMRLGFKLKK